MDLFDIILHAGIATFGSIFVGKWNHHVAMSINTIVWPLREIHQHGGFPTSTQSTLEWVVPVLLGGVVWAIYQAGQDKDDGDHYLREWE